ncbi:hypothetical protein Scep_014026 [Stephania cephalantha]|uniref:Uncharacterized protein n=1 Tax=Stephania cephalantha TaxID=152367 RepID=A0AAP0J194_9MAGN
MEIEAWASSDGSVDSDVDFECNDEEELNYASGSVGKLKLRKDVSKAQWDAAVGMTKVIEKKGGMWTTTGIIRRSELYCSIVRLRKLCRRDLEGKSYSPQDPYERAVARFLAKLIDEKAYKHLKSLGYIVSRHRVPWTSKIDKSSANLTSLDATSENSDILEPEISITKLLQNMQINDMKPAFDVDYPPSNLEIEDLEVCCNVESGRWSGDYPTALFPRATWFHNRLHRLVNCYMLGTFSDVPWSCLGHDQGSYPTAGTALTWSIHASRVLIHVSGGTESLGGAWSCPGTGVLAGARSSPRVLHRHGAQGMLEGLPCYRAHAAPRRDHLSL